MCGMVFSVGVRSTRYNKKIFLKCWTKIIHICYIDVASKGDDIRETSELLAEHSQAGTAGGASQDAEPVRRTKFRLWQTNL